MEKARVVGTEELIERTRRGEGHVVDGSALMSRLGRLLGGLHVLGEVVAEAIDETPEGMKVAVPLEGAFLDLLQDIFSAALEVKKELVAHGMALKEHRESGPSDAVSAPRPTVEGSGRA